MIKNKNTMKAKIYVIVALLITGLTLDSCKKDETSPQATSTFTMSKTKAIIGEEVVFTNTSTNATSFIWSFGDGTTSKEISPKKSFATVGTYQISLVATGSGGSTISTQDLKITPPPSLYFTDTGVGFIESLALDGTGTLSNFFDVTGKGGVGLAYDSIHGKIYFSDFEVGGSGNIWQMNFDKTGLTAVVTDIADDPYGITVDAEGGKIYWADDGGHISRANLNGSDKVDLVTPDDIEDAQFRSNVGLDKTHGKIYFIDYWNENVWRADLDGSNQEVVVEAVYGYNVFVDEVHSKIYFNDMDNDLLEMADLDGSNVTTVDDTGGRIYGIAMDFTLNKLYWSNYSEGAIYSSDPDGSNREVLKSGLDSPRGIFLSK